MKRAITTFRPTNWLLCYFSAKRSIESSNAICRDAAASTLVYCLNVGIHQQIPRQQHFYAVIRKSAVTTANRIRIFYSSRHDYRCRSSIKTYIVSLIDSANKHFVASKLTNLNLANVSKKKNREENYGKSTEIKKNRNAIKYAWPTRKWNGTPVFLRCTSTSLWNFILSSLPNCHLFLLLSYCDSVRMEIPSMSVSTLRIR